MARLVNVDRKSKVTEI